MRIYNYKLNEGTLTISVDEKAGAISAICVEGNELSLPEGCEEEAIAAMALAVDTAINEIVHDDETGIITISPKTSRWNAPEFHFNTISKD